MFSFPLLSPRLQIMVDGGRIPFPRRSEEVKRQQQHHNRKTIGREGKDNHGAVYERL